MTNLSPGSGSEPMSRGSGRSPLVWLGLVGLVIVLLGLNLSWGSVSIPLSETFTILMGGKVQQESWAKIILQFRLPRAITAILAGAALATSGLQMQTLFGNPLAGPFVLGINAGASLGVAIVVLAVNQIGPLALGLGVVSQAGVALAAIAGALATLLLVLAVAHRLRNPITLLLMGLMLGYVTNALVTILLHFSAVEQIQSYLNWTFGSFASAGWVQIQVLAPVVTIGVLSALSLARPLNLLLLGETQAISLGMAVKPVRLGIIGSSAMLAGVVTAFCGPIAFLGVAVPHLGRALFQTGDHRILLPAVSLIGAALALLADLVAQAPGTQVVLPLNAVTALLGAPIVTWVILKQQFFQG